MLDFDQSSIGAFLKQKFADFQPQMVSYEYGTVDSCADGIVHVSGLSRAKYGELLEFAGDLYGIALDMSLQGVSAALLSGGSVRPGSVARGTGRVADVCVGRELLGRVIDPIGRPLDGQPLAAHTFRPVESPAPAIMDRSPVDTPLETGILAVDSMIPIGRGQRELIIGDRQTGKTAIALDTILNQKGKGVICIYVAIGQKASSVAELVQNLAKRGAMDYSIVVSASASDTATMQYIAPYAGCALGEYFMNRGKDVLIVYDDLTKHAIAYRALSLLLERSPGREAYPGDVFYLHSRLLERSAHLSEEKGGGSMTALPIVETQAGDVSAYIPTNIISITDGQIFLESELFFSGQRPAVNVGLSVSRVGGDAQTKAMKTAAGAIRLDLAQFREMEVFTQFSSDLDDLTRQQLSYGQGLMRLLRQPQYHPMQQHEQVFLLVAALHHLLQDLPLGRIDDFRREYLEYMEVHAAALARKIDQTGQMTQEDQEAILDLAEKFLQDFTQEAR